MNKDYDKKIEEIKRYIEEKQNSDTINKNNPIFRENEITREKKYASNIEIEKLINTNDNIENNINEDNINNRRSAKQVYQPYKKDNRLFTIMVLLFSFFATLFIISTHSTRLIKKPFNYISLTIGIASFILLIISIVLKIKHRDLEKTNKKFNKKLTIALILISLINLFIIIGFNIIHFWEYIDIVFNHKKIFFIIILTLIFLLLLFFIIRLILHKKFKPNTKKTFKYLFLTYYVSLFFGLIFTLYGPFNGFKNWLITTAMATMDHQKYCQWFYSDNEIKKVMSNNFIIESGESTDASLINVNKTVNYKDEYERQILEHEDGEKYKVIKLEVAGMPAYLAAIYDPTTIKVEVTQDLGSRGEYVTKMAERNNALLAINGGGFMDPGGSSWGGTPTGVTISNGRLITNNEYGNATTSGGIIGFTKEGTLMLLKNNSGTKALENGIINAVSWGPFLIVNGVSSKINGNGGWGIGARTAIGQRSDGVVLFLVVDSNALRTKGATMNDLTIIMERYGAVNAANLDGGTSSVMVLPKAIAKSKFNATCHDYFTNKYCAINDPIDSTGTHQTRYIATSFVVLDK